MSAKERRALWRAEHKDELRRKREEQKLRRIVSGRSPYTTLRVLHFSGPTAIVEVRVKRDSVAAIIEQMKDAGFEPIDSGRAARHFFELKLRRATLGEGQNRESCGDDRSDGGDL